MEENKQTPEEKEVITDLVIVKTDADKPALKVLGDEVIKKIELAASDVTVLKKKWTKKKIAGIAYDDKKGRELLKAGRAELRTKRTSLTKQLKEEVKPFLDAVSFYRNAYNKVIEVIENMEVPYDEKHAELQQKDKDEAEREEREKRARLDARVSELTDNYAMVFNGSYYCAGDEKLAVPLITIGIVDLETMPDVSYQMLLTKVSETNSLVAERRDAENKRLEKEKKDKDDADARDRLQRIADQKKLDDDKELLQKQLDLQAEEKKELAKMRLETRGEILESIGMLFNAGYQEYVYPGSRLTLSATYIGEADRKEWEETLTDYKARIAAIKQELADAETKRLKAESDNELWRNRLSQLEGIGWNGQYAFLREEDEVVFLTYEQFISLTDAEFADQKLAWDAKQAALKQQALWAEQEKEAQMSLQNDRYEKMRPYFAQIKEFNIDKLYTLEDGQFELMLTVHNDLRYRARVEALLSMGYVPAVMEHAFTHRHGGIVEGQQLWSLSNPAFDLMVQNTLNTIRYKKDEEERLAAAGDQALWDDFVSRLDHITFPKYSSEAFSLASSKASEIINSIKLLTPKL